jgi:hypothetical protein
MPMTTKFLGIFPTEANAGDIISVRVVKVCLDHNNQLEVTFQAVEEPLAPVDHDHSLDEQWIDEFRLFRAELTERARLERKDSEALRQAILSLKETP